jgi:hypothetical protein
MKLEMNANNHTRRLRSALPFLIGIAVGGCAFSWLRPEQISSIHIYADTTEKECRMDWSLARRLVWLSNSSYEDGGGDLTCNESMTVPPGIFVKCICQ